MEADKMQNTNIHLLNALPPELLPYIFAHLDATDLCVVSRVCSEWNDLANDSSIVWYAAYCRRFGSMRSEVAVVLSEGIHWKTIFQERFRFRSMLQEVRDFRQKVKELSKPKTPNILMWLLLFERYASLQVTRPPVLAFTTITNTWISSNMLLLDLVDLGVILCQSQICVRKAEYVLKKALEYSTAVDSAAYMNINNLACAVLMMATLPKLKPEKRLEYFEQAEQLFQKLPDDHETKFSNLACVYSLSQRFDKCKEALERASADGRIGSEYMETEDDFKYVRDLNWFSEILDRVRQRERVQAEQDQLALPVPLPPAPGL